MICIIEAALIGNMFTFDPKSDIAAVVSNLDFSVLNIRCVSKKGATFIFAITLANIDRF